jgi:hypothetical protein
MEFAQDMEVIAGGHLGIWPLAAWLTPAIGAPGIAFWIGYFRRQFRSNEHGPTRIDALAELRRLTPAN